MKIKCKFFFQLCFDRGKMIFFFLIFDSVRAIYFYIRFPIIHCDKQLFAPFISVTLNDFIWIT